MTKMRTVLALALLNLSLVTPAIAGNEGGNGGGGLRRDGRLMTFHSAGIVVAPQPSTLTDIPGLDGLVKFVKQASFLSESSRASLISLILPSPRHEYYRVDANRFDKKVIKNVTAEFAKVTNQPVEGIVLYALTDTSKRQTFLLPAFYSLSALEQAAILYHETFWLMNPTAAYETVVRAEIAFQAVMENPDDTAAALGFLGVAASVDDQVLFAINTDLKTGALAGLMHVGHRVSNEKLFGKELASFRGAITPQVAAYMQVHLADLAAKYPRSLFVQFLRNHLFSYSDARYAVRMCMSINTRSWGEEGPYWSGNDYGGFEGVSLDPAVDHLTGRVYFINPSQEYRFRFF